MVMNPFLLAFLLIVSTWALARFDCAYYQHTVASEYSLLCRRFQNWGKIVDFLFLSVSFVYYYIFFYPIIMNKYTVASLSIFEKLFFLGFIFFCMSLGIFFLWPAFRSYFMLKLGLNPKRYIHRATTCAMFGFFAYGTFNFLFKNYYPSIPHWTELLFYLCIGTITPLLALGWGIKRNGKEIWDRLGLSRKPTWKGFFLACLLLFTFISMEETVSFLIHSIENIWNIKLINDEQKPLLNWFTILFIGISPGIWEELVFRGALQPRVGIWVSSIMFTLLHMQYVWIEILFVLLISLLLGWIARRYSLWLSIWVHTLNNIIVNIMPWVFT